MSNPKTRAYRVTVAVAFGLIGFGVNFLDIEFLEGASFKISILAGLFFPLVVALAWGWRYGLLSALAGGGQAMWWLWHGDGWGVLYSVPVFTLWIVWHGWWADRRSEGHPWYVASFAVEVPFRIVIELGFLVVFRWLVSLNPPPWNPGVSWDHVSSAWLQTVAIKHTITAYILLTAAYVALSLGPVRRFFGLPPRPAQRDTTAIYAGAALFGLLLWMLDALVHYFAFPREGQTFWGIAVYGASAHEVFMRSVYIGVAMLAGAVLARLNRHRVGLQDLLDHRNRILAAIRNVNQLIVREKDPHRLLIETCRLLVENHGYYNAWIVLTTDGRPREPFFHSGFNSGFASMAERLRTGDLPTCAQAALSFDGVQVKDDPPTHCMECPLASTYDGRAGLSLRLEHSGRIFGWISLSCPSKFARSDEEHDLLAEVAGDIAFALWAIETEKQRETLADKYADVLATTSDAVVAGDLDGRINVFNPGAEKLFGCTTEEALGSPITRFCPEDRLAEQAEMMRRVQKKGTVSGYASERLTADGRRVPVEITLSLNTDTHGRPRGTNAIFRDITERKQAEEQIRFQAHIIDNSPIIAAYHDKDLNMVWANKAYQEATGLSLEEIKGKKCYSVWNLSKPCRGCPVIKAIETGEKASYELTSDNQDHWPETQGSWLSEAAPMHDEHGGVIGVIEFASNITERKQVENALKESEFQKSLILNSTQEIFAFYDLDLKILWANQASADSAEMTPEEMVGKYCYEVFRHRKAPCEGCVVLKAQESKQSQDGEATTPDGKIWSLRAYPVLDEQGNVVNLIGLMMDVTSKKQAEAKFESYVTNSPTPIFIANRNGNYTFVNPAACELLGYAKAELFLMNIQDVAHPDEYEKNLQTFPQLLERKKVHQEISLLCKDGSKLYVILDARLLDENNIIAFCTDITESKKAEAEREKLQSQLTQAQKMESVGRLAGGVAHDYNNMLSVIMGNAELALDRVSPDDPLYVDLKEILDAAGRSADITRQLLAFARKQTIRPDVLDLNESVESMLKMLRRLIGEDINLTWHPDPGRMPVFMDPSQLDQILANLCVNARDAISGVGNVTIETGQVHFDEEYCADHAGFILGEFIMLSVSDDGCGMDKDTLANIFEPFFTTKGVGKGTGLGLSTVFGIVKQNDGFINVYSEPGRGTTFRIYLHRHAGEAGRIETQDAAEIPMGRGETVLIVEDEISVLKLAQRILETLGYTVLAASTPGKAAVLAEEHAGHIHLLITDVIMPEMNGRDLAESLKVHYPTLKVLFMSGYTANTIAHQGVLDAGVNFIQKPFSNRDLAVKVREALGRE